MTKHNVAVPVSQLKLVDGKLVLPGATRQALKDVPPFEYARSQTSEIGDDGGAASKPKQNSQASREETQCLHMLNPDRECRL